MVVQIKLVHDDGKEDIINIEEEIEIETITMCDSNGDIRDTIYLTDISKEDQPTDLEEEDNEEYEDTSESIYVN